MSIPAGLERLILDCKARSQSYTFGGSALSSIQLRDGYTYIFWGIQVFPFFDEDNAGIAGTNNSRKVARGVHWFEFASKEYRHGFLHRSCYRLENTVSAPPRAQAIPVNGADYFPVYWVFKGDFVTCRITRPEQPNEKAPVVAVAPLQESANVLPYPPAYPVVTQLPGLGGTTVWGMDRRNTFGVNNANEPRATAVLADLTGLKTPVTNQETSAPFTYPIINVNCVVIPGLNDL